MFAVLPLPLLQSSYLFNSNNCLQTQHPSQLRLKCTCCFWRGVQAESSTSFEVSLPIYKNCLDSPHGDFGWFGPILITLALVRSSLRLHQSCLCHSELCGGTWGVTSSVTVCLGSAQGPPVMGITPRQKPHPSQPHRQVLQP